MRKWLLALCSLLFVVPVLAKTMSYEDMDICRQANEYADSGNEEKARELYEQLLIKYPGNYTLLYEIAYSYLLEGNYQEAENRFKKLLKHKDLAVNTYVAYGASLDYSGQQDKALELYRKGKKRFPKSGEMYLESGVVYQAQQRYKEALQEYTQGIDIAPEYPSNYYRASQLLLGSKEPVWGLMFAEIHQLLQPESERSDDLSKWMCEAFSENIKLDSGKTKKTGVDSLMVKVSLTQNHNIFFDPKSSKLVMTFPMVYELYASIGLDPSIVAEQDSVLARVPLLASMRKSIISMLYDKGLHKEYRYPLFQFQKQVLDAGHWESYNWWLFRKGDENATAQWIEEHRKEFEDFIDWYNEHPFQPRGTGKK